MACNSDIDLDLREHWNSKIVSDSNLCPIRHPCSFLLKSTWNIDIRILNVSGKVLSDKTRVCFVDDQRPSSCMRRISQQNTMYSGYPYPHSGSNEPHVCMLVTFWGKMRGIDRLQNRNFQFSIEIVLNFYPRTLILSRRQNRFDFLLRQYDWTLGQTEMRNVLWVRVWMLVLGVVAGHRWSRAAVIGHGGGWTHGTQQPFQLRGEPRGSTRWMARSTSSSPCDIRYRGYSNRVFACYLIAIPQIHTC